MTLLRVKVYEKQWGDSVATYVRYFENYKQISDFSQHTGFKTEIVGTLKL
ncbi:hypothetical protein [Priestia megaterium]|nr:hypothetical protein [Priestia megaterium]